MQPHPTSRVRPTCAQNSGAPSPAPLAKVIAALASTPWAALGFGMVPSRFADRLCVLPNKMKTPAQMACKAAERMRISLLKGQCFLAVRAQKS
jgi:hypothetical protein